MPLLALVTLLAAIPAGAQETGSLRGGAGLPGVADANPGHPPSGGKGGGFGSGIDRVEDMEPHPDLSSRLRLGTRQLPALLDAAAGFSLRLRGDEERQRALEADVLQASYAFFPKVNLAVEKPLDSRIEYQPDLAEASDSLPRERPSRIGLEATFVLFDGMMRLNTLRAARALADAGRHVAVEAQQQLRLDAATAALIVQRERRRVALRQRSIGLYRDMIHVMNKLFEDRAVTRTDIAIASTRLEQEAAALEIAKGDLRAAELAFARLTGALPPENLSVRPQASRLPGNADEAAERVLAGSPTRKVVELAADAAMYRAMATRADALPKVELAATAGWEYDTSPLIDRTHESAVMVRLRVPLIDATTAPKITAAKAAARQKRYEAQDSVRMLGIEARTLFERRAALIGQIGRLSRQVEEARKTVRGMRIEREAGTRTVIDILDAQGDLVEAELVLAEAEFERDRAAFQLLAAAGELDGGSGE